MHSFGLMETRFYDQAVKVAMEVRFGAWPGRGLRAGLF